MSFPHGLAEIQEFYGHIRIERDKIQGGWRIYDPIGWESANMVLLRDLPGLPGRKLYVHKKVADALLGALTQWQATCPEYAIKSIGCFNPRPKRGNAQHVSGHSWGAAIDINPSTNPMRSPLTTDMPPAFIKAWQDNGWKWGGEFPTPDAMHFQAFTGY